MERQLRDLLFDLVFSTSSQYGYLICTKEKQIVEGSASFLDWCRVQPRANESLDSCILNSDLEKVDRLFIRSCSEMIHFLFRDDLVQRCSVRSCHSAAEEVVLLLQKVTVEPTDQISSLVKERSLAHQYLIETGNANFELIQEVFENSRAINEYLTALKVNKVNLLSLTDREKDVFEGLQHSIDAGELAEMMGIGMNTLNRHLKSLQGKLETSSLNGLSRLSREYFSEESLSFDLNDSLERSEKNISLLASSSILKASRERQRIELTRREREVISLIREDKSNHEIAEILFLSIYTVKSHLRSIFRKFQCRSRRELKELLRK